MRIDNCVLYHATKYNGRNAGKIRTIKKYYGSVNTERIHYINTDKNKMTAGFYYETKDGEVQYGNGYFRFQISPNPGEMCNCNVWLKEENDELALHIFEEKYGRPLRIVLETNIKKEI